MTDGMTVKMSDFVILPTVTDTGTAVGAATTAVRNENDAKVPPAWMVKLRGTKTICGLPL
jgi:predicted NodU family carbamoyl transferase